MVIYRIGDRVYSRQFGRGEVTGIVGFGESVQVRVRFETGDQRDLLARYVDLEVLERPPEPESLPAREEPPEDLQATSASRSAAPAAPLPAAPSATEPSRLRPSPATGSTGPPPASTPPPDRRQAIQASLAELALDLIGAAEIPLMERWAGGQILVTPGKPGLKEKVVPLEAFFHKIVMIRDRLRALEQKINASASLSEAEKVEMQQYLTRVQGSLTTFNFLFRERRDWFTGQSSG